MNPPGHLGKSTYSLPPALAYIPGVIPPPPTVPVEHRSTEPKVEGSSPSGCIRCCRWNRMATGAAKAIPFTEDEAMATDGEHRGPGRPRILKRNPLGERIERLAAARGMNIQQLANASGVSNPSLNRICTGGTSDPHLSTLIALADTLDVTIDKLVGHTRRQARRTA